jgi:quinol monooxygenase YgiN
MITVFATSTFDSIEERDRLLAAINVVAPFTRGEPGVVRYQLGIDFQNPLVTHAVEIYADEDALFAHNRSEHFAKLVAAVSDIKSELSLMAYDADMNPYDLGPAIAEGPLHHAA